MKIHNSNDGAEVTPINTAPSIQFQEECKHIIAEKSYKTSFVPQTTSENFIRIKNVSYLTSIARSTIWLWVKEGRFPKPIKVSPRVTVWKLFDIQQWQEHQVQGDAA